MNKRSVATSYTLRAAAVLAVVVVVSVVVVVYRTVEQAQVSNQSVLHTQEVLTSLEAVLATVLDADVAVRRFTASSDSRTFEPFDPSGTRRRGGYQSAGRADSRQSESTGAGAGTAPGDARALAALRVVADAKRGGSVPTFQQTPMPHRRGMDSRAEHHAGDACGGEPSAWRTACRGSGRRAPSSADLDRPRGRRLGFLGWISGSSPATPVANGREPTRCGKQTRTWKRRRASARRICETRMRGCDRSSTRRSMASS